MRILHNILILLCMLLGLSACNDDSMTQGNEGGSVLPNGEVVLKIAEFNLQMQQNSD